jgi:hypothetical protein
MLRFNRGYFIIAITIFVIEVLIALFLNDNFIRPYFGDVLVVIMLYCFVMAFLKGSQWYAALFVLLFSFAIETLQYLNFIDKLGLQDNKIAQAVIGTSFSWNDILCYLAGIITVILIERLRLHLKRAVNSRV